MHPAHLIELAAVVAQYHNGLIQQSPALPKDQLERFTHLYCQRCLRWEDTLTAYHDTFLISASPGANACWPGVKATLAEIITGDVLVRVWSAAVAAHHALHGESTPWAERWLLLQTRCSTTALRFMVRGPFVPLPEAAELNRLQHRVERWTDLLLGALGEYPTTTAFAFCSQRMREFCRDWQEHQTQQRADLQWSWALASLKSGFAQLPWPLAAAQQSNGELAKAVLGCFSAELFSHDGLLRWTKWLDAPSPEMLPSERPSRWTQDEPFQRG